MHLAKNHKKVAVVERMARVGGACTHSGTIPSKSLRHAIFRVAEANKNPLLRETDITLQLTYPQLRKTAGAVIERQVEMRHTYYERNNVALVSGQARFIDPNTIEADEESG